MGVIFVPSTGPGDWQRLLADPVKHWKTGFSARSFAYAWEDADGFPPEITNALEETGEPDVKELRPLIVIPEHEVPLPGGRRPSQNDAWVLARNEKGLVSIAVEGKVEEPFGPTIGEWLGEASEGKNERLGYLADIMGIDEDGLGAEIRYQLMHRTASAIIEANRFHASTALMIVHSFSPAMTWFDDYAAFCELFTDQAVRPDSVVSIGQRSGVACYLAWVRGDKRFLKA